MSKKENDQTEEKTTSSQPVDKYFYIGNKCFALPNGDTYTGQFWAHRLGLIWREGSGCYCTHDGHIYQGQWRDDKLLDSSPITISYSNGDVFEGVLKKDKYESSGSVVFKDGFRLAADFSGNKPVGSCHLIDPFGQLWKNREPDKNQSEDIIYFRPENVFFNNIHPLRGVQKELLADIEPDWTPENMRYFENMDEESDYQPEINLEALIFDRISKVAEDTHDWRDSEWYKHFAEYKEKRQKILSKIETHEKLTSDENKWYKAYVCSKRQKKRAEEAKLRDALQPTVDTTLLEQFYSDEHRTRSKPYTIVYPSYYWRIQDEPEEEETMREESIMEGSDLYEEMVTEEASYYLQPDSVSEESVTPNPSIGCGTSSLFKYVATVTGADIKKTCLSNLDATLAGEEIKKVCVFEF